MRTKLLCLLMYHDTFTDIYFRLIYSWYIFWGSIKVENSELRYLVLMKGNDIVNHFVIVQRSSKDSDKLENVTNGVLKGVVRD